MTVLEKLDQRIRHLRPPGGVATTPEEMLGKLKADELQKLRKWVAQQEAPERLCTAAEALEQQQRLAHRAVGVVRSWANRERQEGVIRLVAARLEQWFRTQGVLPPEEEKE